MAAFYYTTWFKSKYRKNNNFVSKIMHIRTNFSKSMDKKKKKKYSYFCNNGYDLLLISKKWHAFVRYFSGRKFNVNAVAKIMGPI